MKVTQIAEMLNTITAEMTGVDVVVTEDLRNITDLGTQISDTNNYDNYVKKLFNHIGKVEVFNRVPAVTAPNILRSGWEWGSMLERILVSVPEAQEEESYSLVNGQSYDEQIFYAPDVSAKFFNKAVVFKIPMSFTRSQLKESFSNATQYSAFISGIENAVQRSIALKTNGLIKRAINNFIGETVYDEFPSGGYGDDSGVKAVNLLYLYNADHSGSELTADTCLSSPEFLRFASSVMSMYVDRLKEESTLFNIGEKVMNTPEDMLHFVILSEFSTKINTNLYSGTFHDEFVKLPKHETVAYWQGSGEGFAFEDTSSIDITTASGHNVELSGILGVMFDHDGVAVNNEERWTTSNVNTEGDFWTNRYKFKGSYINDTNYNFVVFYVEDETT